MLIVNVNGNIDVYAWSTPLKEKKGITKAFQKLLGESGRKSGKIWVDKCCQF